MKKILITSTDLMMIQFLVPHVRHLHENGFSVEIACSEVGGRMNEVRGALEEATDAIHCVCLERNPVSPRNLLGYRDMRRLLEENQYDIIWTNEPVMGVVTRLAARDARKSGTRVVYMCHGFHFFKGASAPNWLLFYPVERVMSRFCDCITTINREDEARAQTFHAPRVEYIHGIGMDTQRLHPRNGDRTLRQELSLPQDAFLVLSVGELNENKNHKVILQALSMIQDPSVHYCICGKGELLERLTAQAVRLGIADRVHFLGYRTDVVDICAQADVFVLPSYREGLSVASLEAMYCGLPLITSRVRGSSDYLQEGVSGFLRDADDAVGFADAIRTIQCNSDLRSLCSTRNRETVVPYCMENVQKEILTLFNSL